MINPRGFAGLVDLEAPAYLIILCWSESQVHLQHLQVHLHLLNSHPPPTDHSTVLSHLSHLVTVACITPSTGLLLLFLPPKQLSSHRSLGVIKLPLCRSQLSTRRRRLAPPHRCTLQSPIPRRASSSHIALLRASSCWSLVRES